MKYVSSKRLLMLFMAVMASFPLHACADENVKPGSDKAKLAECLANGKKFEYMVGESEQETWSYQQKAQEYYLCAEKEGDAEAGYIAAALGAAGVADTLPEKEMVRLYSNAAKAGNFKAAYALYRLYCGDTPNTCSRPQEARKWISQMLSLDSGKGLYYLADFYEKGYDGTVDVNRAAACFKLAAEKGYAAGKIRLDQVTKKIDSFVAVDCF